MNLAKFFAAVSICALLVPGTAMARYRTGEQASHTAPIWKPFTTLLAKCDSTCKPVNYNAWRHTNYSCHNVGRALDVHGFKCGDKYYGAGTSKFSSIVRCFRGNGMKVIYQSANHYDHGHFSIKCFGGSHW